MRTASRPAEPGYLPEPPDDDEKYSYARRTNTPNSWYVLLVSVAIVVAFVLLVDSDPWLIAVAAAFVFTAAYRLTWLATVPFARRFDLDGHLRIVAEWAPERFPSVDVFLPVCGERLDILSNSWNAVAALVYPGELTVYCLDDGASSDVATLAEEFGFRYLTRPDRGVAKKAGNLRFGYRHSSAEFVAIFDADFCPRPDFLTELLPHFDADPALGIVQSPQYFRAEHGRTWTERGACAVQEPFYRELQTKRDHVQAAICVGSNAIYRRAALDANGGTALVDYSEDVHTGIELRARGWHLRYLPVVLAAGLSPDELPAFFIQQYRWARGCLGLRLSAKFWRIKMPVRSRLAYMSGPLFHFHQIVLVMLMPMLMIAAVLVSPASFETPWGVAVLGWPLARYAGMVAGRGARTRRDAALVRLLATWSGVFAAVDFMTGDAMSWQATGGRIQNMRRFVIVRHGLMLWNEGWSLGLVVVGAVMCATHATVAFLPMALVGTGSFLVAWRVQRDAVSALNALTATAVDPAGGAADTVAGQLVDVGSSPGDERADIQLAT